MSCEVDKTVTAKEKPTGEPVNRGGAPRGNVNGASHFVRSWGATGKLPTGCAHIGRRLGQLRLALESAVVSQGRSLGVIETASINRALRYEGSALLAAKYLRLEAGLSLADRLGLLGMINASTEARDKAIARLKLDATGQPDPWAVLDGKGTP